MNREIVDNLDVMLDLVNEQDEVIGEATRRECHQNPDIIHRIVAICIFNQAGQLLMQHRSEKKDIYPGLWTISVSGHPDQGEAVDKAAHRESLEELGCEVELELVDKRLFRYDQQSELASIYVGYNEGPFEPDPDEVQEVRFLDLVEIEKGVVDITPGAVNIIRVLIEKGLCV